MNKPSEPEQPSVFSAKPLGVLVRGQWLPEPELQTRLGQLVCAYSLWLLDRLWSPIIIMLGLFPRLRRPFFLAIFVYNVSMCKRLPANRWNKVWSMADEQP
jgi:hypothetical protein